ncbi:MAG TPA: hypothetical protein VEK13_06315 [Thermoplasmata archaeon]|nr:hypothetical protein [Thermoplasmata archaeon]
MASIDLSIWITILATWVLAVGTLAFAYWQLRQNQRLHSTTTLLDLRDRFYSPRMRQARRALSAWLLRNDRGEEPENWEVALFFELVGSLTRSRNLDRKLVRKAFGTWITGYYTGIKEPSDLFDRWRKESNDPQIFADFEWLAQQVIMEERRLAPGPGFDQSLREEARYVLQGEAQLDVDGSTS